MYLFKKLIMHYTSSKEKSNIQYCIKAEAADKVIQLSISCIVKTLFEWEQTLILFLYKWWVLAFLPTKLYLHTPSLQYIRLYYYLKGWQDWQHEMCVAKDLDKTINLRNTFCEWAVSEMWFHRLRDEKTLAKLHLIPMNTWLPSMDLKKKIG